jgi:PHD/YefM family antitoxin component YafN of YafNO toxin-antitoxin module
MTVVNPQILKKDGKPSFVVLTYEEYRALAKELEDLRDSLAIRAAARADKGLPTHSLAQARAMVGKRRKAARAA